MKHVQGKDSKTGEYVLSARNQDLVFCLPLVGAIIGAFSATILNTRFGRKWVVIACYVSSYGGTFLQTFSPNLGAFVVGRFWNSINLGIATATAPLYLSEIVPAKYRGLAVTSGNIFNLFSGVIGTIIANATHARPHPSAWQIPLGVQAVMPTILIPLSIFVPESPLWLLTQDRVEEAKHNLKRLRAYDDVLIEDELRLMKVTFENERTLNAGSTFLDLFRDGNLRRTLVAGSMYSVNQISGIILSTTYATVFLTQLGVAAPFTLTIVAAVTQLVGTCVAPLLVDRVGRRPLAIVGFSLLMIIDFICGGLAFVAGNKSNAMAIAALSFIFNFIWTASFYALSITLPTEIPAPKLRSKTTSYTFVCAYTTAVITTFAVPQLTAADAANLGAKTYLIFGGCVAIILVCYYIFLPETAGRTLAEIDEMYANKVPARKWKSYKTSAAAQQAVVLNDSEVAHAHS